MYERRVDPRMLCSELVDVAYADQAGRIRRAQANLEDISTSGVCLQVELPIPLHTSVSIQHPKGEFQGTVRYCLFREIGYFLGVQFEPGCHWSPRSYRPRHMLDLRKLVTRSARRAAGRGEAGPKAQ